MGVISESIGSETVRGTEELRLLVDRGKDRGFLTYDEIIESLMQEDFDGDQIEDLLEIFAQEGIEVIQKLIPVKEFVLPMRIEDIPTSDVVKDPEIIQDDISYLEGPNPDCGSDWTQLDPSNGRLARHLPATQELLDGLAPVKG